MIAFAAERGCLMVCRTPGKATDSWYHILPRGEFAVQATIRGEDRDITLVVDDAAFDRIVEQYREDSRAENWEGYLVGQEHFAHNPAASSEAHAWCTELEVRADGLWGRFEKTALGEKTIGSIYKFRSPVGNLDQIEGDRWRPVSIVDIGLTNMPKFKTLASAKGRQANNPKEDAMLERMREILAMPDATEDQVYARVGEIQARATELETTQQTLADLRNTVLAREADTFVETHRDRIDDTDEARNRIKARYIADAEGTKAVFAGLRVAGGDGDKGGEAGAQRVLARDTARTPKASAGGESAQTQQAQVRAARIHNRATQMMASDRKLQYGRAWSLAEAEEPAEK